MKILIADDDAGVSAFLRDLVTAKGHFPEVASDGEKTMRLVKKNDYDLIFLDFEMPEITGLELAKIIKQKSPKAKVVLITGYDLIEGFMVSSVGADEFLTKPLEIEKIKAVLEKYSVNPSTNK